MSWERILQIDHPERALRERIDSLFMQQRATWPMLREGEAVLAHLERKTLTDGSDSVIVQINPARRRSTLAKTDAKAVAARACFLCPENMPPEERGAAFEDLVLMPNPFPILPIHCTIADRIHRPQQLHGRVATCVHLAQAIGPDLAALYNGPRCGASAPDHFHLQAARADQIPILAQLPKRPEGDPVVAHSSFGRNMLIVRGSDAGKVTGQIEHSIAALQQLQQTTDEPMFNLLGHFTAGHYTIILFPRAAHRPACYFSTGPDQLLISPAVLEMAGILVATEHDHFARVDTPAAHAIYNEVSIDAEQFERLAATI